MRHEISPGVYQDTISGEFLVDPTRLPGSSSVSGVGEDYGDDDVDISGILDNDDAFGDDDAAAIRYLAGEIGRIRNPRKRRRAEERLEKRVSKLDRKAERKGIDLDNTTRDTDGPDKGRNMKGWIGTAIGGSWTAGATGTQNITITPQHDFRGRNFKATGPSGSLVNSIQFGDKLIWSSSTGIDVAFLGATSTLQALVESSSLRVGQSILVNVTAGAAGTVSVMFDGYKPQTTC